MPRRSSSRLDLAGRICGYIHEQRLAPGDRVNEKRLAEWLGVSRTPVRAALEELATHGYVERRSNLGMTLVKPPPLPAPGGTRELDELVLRVARDRHKGVLAEFISESDLMQAYGLTRLRVREALERLANLGAVERKLASGWRFLAAPWDSEARRQSYQFRLTVEPAAMQLPGFALAPAWMDDMRQRHQRFLQSPWDEHASIEFFEMNAAFHLGIAAGSGNRHFADVIERQNMLRRLSNYDWRYGQDRVRVSTREHLEILDKLAAGDIELAALLMRRHLEGAMQVRSMPRQDCAL